MMQKRISLALGEINHATVQKEMIFCADMDNCDNDIKRAGEHVAGLKANRKVKDGSTMYGVYKGVRVGVKRTKGNISTIFPDSDQSPVLKRRKKR